MLILAIFIDKITDVINWDTKIESYSYNIDLTTDSIEYDLTIDDFDFGIRLEYTNYEQEPDIQKNLD